MIRYAITDRSRLASDEPARRAALVQQTARLACEGIDFLLLREKDLNAASLATLARELVATLRDLRHPTRLLIHSRPDIAIAVQADGVHLTSAPGTLAVADIRRLYRSAKLPAPILSISCHTLEEVTLAGAGEPDPSSMLILFGPVFGKSIAGADVSLPAGLNLLRAACSAASPIPVLALGGITTENTSACIAAGAAGVAAIRLFDRPFIHPSVDSLPQP